MTVKRIGEWESKGQTVVRPQLDARPAVRIDVSPDVATVGRTVDGVGWCYTRIPWPVIDELLRLRAALNQEPGK